MNRYVKHASLINSCYPEKEGETGPRSSELSYLTFYASSRPVKLTKVGIFLEKKVERDVSKNRKQSNRVSLEIIKALIQSCNRDLNLFSKYVIKILTLIIGTKDIELVDLACDTYIVFASFHDGTTLGVDSDLTSAYETLVKRFAEFCNDDVLQKRAIGHRAIQATISSSALHTSNFSVQLGLVLPPLLSTLANASTLPNVLEKSGEEIDIRRSTLNDSSLSDETVSLLAAHSIALLFRGVNGTTVRMALSPVFDYIESRKKWWPPNFSVSIMELILDSLQPQNRYLLISELLSQVERTMADDDIPVISDKLASLVSILDAVLNANIPLVGISVFELLNALFTCLIKSIQGGVFRNSDDYDASDLNSTFEFVIHQGFAHSIGGLALQIYYQNQLNDITSYLVSKMKVGSSIERIDGLPVHEYRRIALICLDQVVATSKEAVLENDGASQFDEASLAGLSISSSAWVPALQLLTCKTPVTRIDFANSLTRYLQAGAPEIDTLLEPFPKHLLTQHSDIVFVNAVQQTIVDWMQLPDCNVHDIDAMYAVLCALTRRFGADGTITNLPLVFHLQALVKKAAVKPTSRQRALAAATVEWLGDVAVIHQIARLADYVRQIKSERIENREYSLLFLPEIRRRVGELHEFDDLEPENTTPVDSFLDRHVVVEIISKNSQLRDEEDTDGMDLESKLYATWGTDAVANHDRSFRIRSSQDFDSFKAKLATPWVASDFNHTSQGQTNAIRVENLKEALVSQQQTAETNGDQELDSLQVMTKKSLAKRTKETKLDIDSVLSSLNLGPDLQNTPSLINPPYKG